MSAVLSTILPTKPSADEVAEAAPLRAKVRSAVLERKDIFDKELPTYYDTGLSYWQIRPMKTFLETELAWWNANIELTTQQVNTRKTSYIEQLQPLNKDLTAALKTALAALPPEKSAKILATLKADNKEEEGFGDLPTKPKDIDLTGATKSIDLAAIEKSVIPPKDISGSPTPTQPTTLADDVSSALKLALKIVGIILYICIALRIAAFVANDLLYKLLPYRALAFIYAFIFAPFLAPYYLYREFAHRVWPGVEPTHFESLFPMTPYDPSEPITFDKRIYGYADTPEIRAWIHKMQAKELES